MRYFLGMTIRRAVTVEPSLVPARPISVPTAMALGCTVVRRSTTRIGLPNVQVRVKPSEDLTVTVLSLMAVTVPRWTSMVFVPLSVSTTASPCRTFLPSHTRPGSRLCPRSPFGPRLGVHLRCRHVGRVEAHRGEHLRLSGDIRVVDGGPGRGVAGRTAGSQPEHTDDRDRHGAQRKADSHTGHVDNPPCRQPLANQNAHPMHMASQWGVRVV